MKELKILENYLDYLKILENYIDYFSVPQIVLEAFEKIKKKFRELELSQPLTLEEKKRLLDEYCYPVRINERNNKRSKRSY